MLHTCHTSDTIHQLSNSVFYTLKLDERMSARTTLSAGH
jgi:hypothetical protein